MSIKYSVILFTYNPHKGFIRRVLKSIANLDIGSAVQVEYIISDNNSSNNWIKEVLSEFSETPFQILEEKTQGKIFSIINAFSKAKGQYLVCLDDDNEIDENYLTKLDKLIEEYPDVWAWGPAKITVEFEDKIPEWLDCYHWFFQEKDRDEILFGNKRYWNGYYPSGTGLVIKQEVGKEYLKNVKKGKMTATCRKGGALSSGGDSQIVYCAILLGKYVGTAPQLIINHLTEKKKCTVDYCKKLVFGVFSCGIYHVEVFPEARERLVFKGQLIVLKKVFKEFVKSKFNLKDPHFNIRVSRLMADQYSWYESNGKELPKIYKAIIANLDLK
jgi:glycosyltransferase involved in cell wall biosynthesis